MPRRNLPGLRDCQIQPRGDNLPSGEDAPAQFAKPARLSNAAVRRQTSPCGEDLCGAIARLRGNVKRSRKAATCQTWKIPACGAIIKPCANAKRSCKVAICRAAKTLRQPRSQPAVAYVHGFPCPQVCFPVSRALSRWQSVIPTPPCLRPALQSAETPPGPLRAT